MRHNKHGKLSSSEDPEREMWLNRARRAIITKRGRRHYQHVFDMRPGEFMLDLGPGLTRYLPPNGVSLDLLFADYPRIGGNRDVGGIFQQLPFADGVFDRVVASYSLYHIEVGLKEALSEALRVLRPGGALQIYPANRNNKRAADVLEHQGITQFDYRGPRRIQTIATLAAGGIAGYAFNNRFGVPDIEYDLLATGMAALTVNHEVSARFFHGSTLTITNDLPVQPSTRLEVIEGISSAYTVGPKTHTFRPD